MNVLLSGINPQPRERPHTLEKVLWCVILGAFVAVIGVFYWSFGSEAPVLGLSPADFRPELLKLLCQFLLIVVMGGAVGLFFKAQERVANVRQADEDRARERRLGDREALLQVRADLVKAYNEAKAVRRLLRGLALDEAGGMQVVLRSEYGRLMGRLIDSQLQFEYYAELAQSDSRFRQTSGLKAHLDSLERYLHDIVADFEDSPRIFGSQEKPSLEKFKYLKKFVQKDETDSIFDTQFKKPFHVARDLIQAAADKTIEAGER